jgi:hypothetical protein
VRIHESIHSNSTQDAGISRHARVAGDAGTRACSQPAAAGNSARNAQYATVANPASGAGMPPNWCRLT